jgi:FkbM family methyltransferase
MTRGFDFYARSINKRGNILADSYCLKHIEFSSDDIVIDCGANYGDLYLYLRDKINEQNYIALEPGPIEYQCLLNSVPKAQVLNYGLSNSDGELDFYLCSKSGDSSLVKPKNYTEVVKVSVKTLDSLVDDLKIAKCKLLKLEAEGWEPEILDGAKEFIKLCDFVAIDGGLERGVNEKATFPAINNFLMKNGFEMIDIHGPSYRALFQKVL